MNPSQIVSHWLHIGTSALGAFLVVHGSLAPSVASQVAQIVGGVVLALGASAFHSLRFWIDKSNPALARFVDPIDGALAETETVQQTTASVTTTSGKALFQEVAAGVGTK